MASFRFLIASSPTILLQHHRPGLETRIWPTTTDTIICFYHGPSGFYEASYSVPSGHHGLQPVQVHRASGNAALFPEHGQLTYGSNVVIPSDLDQVASTTSNRTRPSSTTDPVTQSQQQVADTFNKANRKPSDGTRLLADTLPDTVPITILSSNPTLAGRQPLYNVMHTFLSNVPWLPCSNYPAAYTS